jgi:hypothetical protein
MLRIKGLVRKQVIMPLMLAIVFVASIYATAIPVNADVLQGSGTAADPYIITTAERLASVPSIGLDKYYKLANDIDLSTYGTWTPIGNSTNKFMGNFNGNGHKITGIKVGPSKYADKPNIGLFGCISGATISNLGVSAVIYSSGDYVGALVGWADASTISNCYSVAELSCTGSSTGGLLGYAQGSNISGCHFSGTVVGAENIGGLIGYLYSSNLYSSYSTGTVSGTGNSIGGLVGYYYVCKSNNSIGNCYSSSDVTGNSNVGGFIGLNQIFSEYSTKRYNTIYNCYATGNIMAVGSYAGGFTGHTLQTNDRGAPYTQMTNCYSIGKVIGTSNAGGFSGYQEANPTITNCYWCYTNSPNTSLGVASSSGSCTLSGLADTDMKDQSFIDALNYNIYNLKLSGCNAWKIVTTRNNGYPVLDGVGDGDTTDTVAPSGSYTLSTAGSTTGPVTIFFSATDDNSGVKSITLPDNTVVNATSATYSVKQNGKYNFIVTDNSGNTAVVGAVVSNIISSTADITAPSGSYTLSTIAATTGPVIINLNAADDGSGVKSITLPDNTIVTASNATYTVTANGNYRFIITDNAGNTSAVSVPVTNITGSTADVTAPSATYTLTSGTSGSVIIKINATDDSSGVKSITLPDASVVNASTATYTVTATGTYKFIITDKSGNTNVLTINVTSLNVVTDQTAPTGTYNLSTTEATSGTVTISFTGTDENSGVKLIILPDGSMVSASTVNYTVSANGIYNFTVVDNAGNVKTIPVIVSNISNSSGLTVVPVNVITYNGSSATIIINVSGSTTISVMKWTNGTQDAAFFKAGGTVFTGNAFTVSTNGTYTVYIQDASGNVIVKTFTVGNINPGNDTPIDNPPVDLSDVPSVVDIVTAKSSTYAITADGDVYSWGYNNCGQLGLGNNKSAVKPMKIPGLTDVCQIMANDNYSVFAITVDGDVYSWGYNNYGQLGIGNTKTAYKPVKVSGLSNVTNMIVKNDTVYAFTSDGETYAWGNNLYGKLGIKGSRVIKVPTKISGFTGF